MRVDDLVVPDQLDVLVAFDSDMPNPGRRRRKEAGDRVQVLVEEAAMRRLDPRKLRGVEHVLMGVAGQGSGLSLDTG